MNKEKKLVGLLLVLIVLLGFYLRVHGINYHSYGDEHFHVYNSLGLITGQIPGNFHRIALFLFYGLFYIVGWVLGIFTDTSDFIGVYFSRMHIFYYAGRLFESIIGTAAILMLYILGKKMFSRLTGLTACMFLAVSPVAVEISQKARGQALCLLLIIASLTFSYMAIGNKRRYLFYLLSGLCFGAAFSIRVYAGIIVIPIAFFFFKSEVAKFNSFFNGPFTFNLRKILFLARKLFVNIGIVILLFSIIISYILSAPHAIGHFSSYLTSHLATLSIGAESTKIYIGSEFPNSLRYYLTSGFPRAISLPLYVFSIIILIIGIFRFNKKNYAPLLLSVILYVVVMGRGSIAAPRYLFPIFPALFLVAGDVLVITGKRIKIPPLIIFVGAFLLTVPAMRMVINQNSRNLQPTTKDIAEEWIFANLPSGTRIAVESMGYRGPDLKLTPVIDYWIYNLNEKELKKLLKQRVKQGQPSVALKYFIKYPPTPKYYTKTISVRDVVNVSELHDSQYQYIVTSQRNKTIYEKDITRKNYPEHYRARQEFYSWLEERGELIKKFLPDSDTPGDELRIYKIRNDR